ncbi:MAG: tetratricopeptide repeat protein [Actinomycetota bacterium]|nr:tetratricopeptide repeat protein [Actinomycetota bacterium]
MGGLTIRVLGPLEAVRDGRPVELGGAKPRAVLAMLALGSGRPVRTEALLDAVWPSSAPPTGVKTLQKYVSTLRSQLGEPDFIVSVRDGYRLGRPDAVDVAWFARLVDQGRRESDPARAAAVLKEALALWRAEPYLELADAAVAERGRLGELRLSAVEALMDARLRLGEHAALVPELEELVATHPLRERLWGQLMLGLHGSGQRAAALAVYARLRATLAAELGVDPSPEVRALHQRLLRQEDQQESQGLSPAAPGRGAPRQLTSFVGREEELGELETLLSDVRLVTVTGPAGSGKTRLALELLAGHAETYPDGGWLVELAAVTGPDPVNRALHRAFGLTEQPNRSPRDSLDSFLADRQLLLVLDNCEHLAGDVASALDRLLRAAPGLRVLATSREPVRVAGEVRYDLAPLPVPPADVAAPSDAAAFDAVRLLVDRAAAADPHFTLTATNTPAVVQICHRLDGMPLALELAAARLHAFEPDQLAELLDDRFEVLVSALRTAPARHQTLRAAVAWSYDLLTADEQALFRRLAVFAGSFDLAAAKEVCGFEPLDAARVISLLPALVERSLVVPQHGRYRLLETLREYGRAHLQPDESKDAHLRQLNRLLLLAEDSRERMHTPVQAQVVAHLDAEQDNLRAALLWAYEHGERVSGLRLAVALSPYWHHRELLSEASHCLTICLQAATDAPAQMRAAGYLAAADVAIEQGHAGLAERLARHSVELAHTLGDHSGIAGAGIVLGRAAMHRGEYETAARLLTDCVAAYERLGMPWEAARARHALGMLARQQGDYAVAHEHHSRSLAAYRAIGDRLRSAYALWALGVVARYQGDLAAATARCEEARQIMAESDEWGGVAHVTYTLGDIARLDGDYVRARELYTDSHARLAGIGDERCTASTAANLGAVALKTRDAELAGRWYAHSLMMRRRTDDRPGIAESLEGLARCRLASGDLMQAARLLGASRTLRESIGVAVPVAEQADHQAFEEQLRGALGPVRFAAEHRVGSQLDVDQVVTALV